MTFEYVETCFIYREMLFCIYNLVLVCCYLDRLKKFYIPCIRQKSLEPIEMDSNYSFTDDARIQRESQGTLHRKVETDSYSNLFRGRDRQSYLFRGRDRQLEFTFTLHAQRS